MALVVKNPPATAGDRRDAGQSLSQEDPLEEGTATHSSILAWRIPWTEEPSGYSPQIGSHRVRHDGNDLACFPSIYKILSLTSSHANSFPFYKTQL